MRVKRKEKNMNEILILFVILGSLYILENKSINLLAYYVGMVIIIAILISIYPNRNEIEEYWSGISYISYILILVQISALTILFGFIIMLFPKNNTEILIKQRSNYLNKEEEKLNNNYKLLLGIISALLSVLIIITKDINIIDLFKEIKITILENNIEINSIQKIQDLENNVSTFLNKISYLLYGEPSNILKFIILTIILLFAIICLFFILFPTI